MAAVRHASKDGNHNTIVERFLSLGCTIVDIHSTGIPGLPDLGVGCVGITHLVEIKNKETRYGRAGLNPNQTAFARDWRGGGIWIVHDVDEVTKLVQRWRAAVRKVA